MIMLLDSTANVVSTNNAINSIDILTLIFSIIAIIVSVSVALTESSRDYKINRLNIEADYFREIYKDFLVKDIPVARKKLHFEKSQLIGTDDLIIILKKMRQDSLYFEFRDKTFYDSLKKKLQTLEDYLFEKVEEGTLSIEKQSIFFKQVNTYIESIYKCIAEAHFGEKQKPL